MKEKNYLIIDKEHRVKGPREGKYATAVERIMSELANKDIPYSFAYNTQIEFILKDNETSIKVNGAPLTQYSHIIFRGHNLHNPKEYETKRLIVDWVDQYNKSNRRNKILVQNSEAIKNMPYYNKIFTAQFCSTHNIPYFDTYYRTDGAYEKDRDILENYPLIIKEYSGVNRVDKKWGKRIIKKNVYKLNSVKDLNKKHLKDQDLSNFFIQEFTKTAQDIRVFIKLGKVIGGWRREATEGFITVNKGKYSMYNTPSKEVREIAEKFAKEIDADFIAVDFMFKEGKPYVQEISLHPGFKAYETKIEDGEPVNIAEAIITAFRK
jgi:glutathione synthase/RimK-type ligase-like ATP-grasp enzyme